MNIEHALKDDLLDNKQRKLLENKILALKMNVIKQFPLPIICAAVYKVGSGVCAQEFEKYIIFIGGICNQMANIYNYLQGFSDEEKLIARKAMKVRLFQDFERIKSLDIVKVYSSNGQPGGFIKDTDFYRQLHFEIIGGKPVA